YDSRAIDALARASGARVAILYPDWFRPYGGLPAAWNAVGQWRISRNLVCGADSVSIYALEPDEMGPLERHLRDFDATLPASGTRSGAYTRREAAPAAR